MEKNSNLYKTITETVPEFFFVYNLLQKKITFVSPRFYELADSRPSHEQADSGEDVSHDHKLRSYIDPQDLPAIEQFFIDLSPENNFTNRIELRTVESLGDIRWIELNTFPVEQEQGAEVSLVVGHITDITKNKERLELMQQEQDKLDSLIKILAHDLRGPFSQVYMIADILRNMMDEQEEERFGLYLGMLKKLGGRSITLLDNLLHLVVLQEGSLSLDLKKHDLRKILATVMEDFEVSMQEKKIDGQLKVPDFAVVADVDSMLLQQALSNLLSNAVKFTKEEGSILLEIEKQDGKACIKVQDTGIGIPQDHVPELFKEFSRMRRKGLRGEKSTGLGLAISRQIIKLHQGEISVESKEQQGTTFGIVLPLC